MSRHVAIIGAGIVGACTAVEALRRERSFCHDRTLGHAMARYKSHEVDDLIDFLCVEAVAANLETILQEEGRTSPSGER